MQTSAPRRSMAFRLVPLGTSVLLAALWVVPLERVAYSVLAAVVMGVFLWISHRPGRYAGG